MQEVLYGICDICGGLSYLDRPDHFRCGEALDRWCRPDNGKEWHYMPPRDDREAAL